MARAFWKGSLSFGLVEIPVRLRPAVRSDDLSFSLLDRKDFSPVGNKRYNKNTGREVPWERVVRGYEHEPDEFVVLSDEELKRANVKATQTIEILEFVDLADIDSVFFDTPYYVEPEQKGSKAYTLLRETLERTGKAAIARVVLRTRQHLAAVVVRGTALVLNLLHYPSEIVPATEVEAPATTKRVSPKEVEMAERLVQGMTAKWSPSKYRDEYRDDVLALVRRKVKSGDIHTIVEPDGEADEKPRREVMDLMPLLKQSLEARERGAKKTPASKPARKPARKSAASRSARGHKKSA